MIGVIACVSAVALQRCPIDHLKHALPHRVRIPEQHAQVAVPADRGHLRRREPHLEEAAESLVAKVVEMEGPARRLTRSQASLEAFGASTIACKSPPSAMR